VWLFRTFSKGFLPSDGLWEVPALVTPQTFELPNFRFRILFMGEQIMSIFKYRIEAFLQSYSKMMTTERLDPVIRKEQGLYVPTIHDMHSPGPTEPN
jgi:hypothetical protein